MGQHHALRAVERPRGKEHQGHLGWRAGASWGYQFFITSWQRTLGLQYFLVETSDFPTCTHKKSKVFAEGSTATKCFCLGGSQGDTWRSQSHESPVRNSLLAPWSNGICQGGRQGLWKQLIGHMRGCRWHSSKFGANEGSSAKVSTLESDAVCP